MAERRGKGLQIPLHGFKSRSDLQAQEKAEKQVERSTGEDNE